MTISEYNKTKMNRYANGKIYKLANDLDGEIYVGSCCTGLAKRKNAHKSRAKSDADRRVYKHLNEVGWENVRIVLIEEYQCRNKMELERRERYWIESLIPSRNMVIPIRELEKKKAIKQEYDKVYRAKHRERKNKNDNIRYHSNKEEINEKRRTDRVVCECGAELRRQDLTRHKRTAIHAKKLRGGEYNLPRAVCECGAEVSKWQLKRHRKTKKHLEFNKKN